MMSPTQNDCHSFQLINEKGEFNENGLLNFITATNLSKCGLDYALIAIIGRQSSGKSTFMNHFGGTNFKQMNPNIGRMKETHGIWIANCVTIDRPFTIAMDIEGTDGVEKGEDTAFEGQSALFALAVADTVIVNLWYHDIGRQNAANIPLLRTIFQIRMTRMSKDGSRKAKLCFIVRDMEEEETSLAILEEQIKTTMEKIWTTIATSNDFESINISDFFHVLVFGLSHYKYKRKEFEDQVAELREQIISVDREGVMPARAFQANAHQLWKSIKDEPFLNLPAHSEMIAEHMCKEIANTCRESLSSSEGLKELEKEVEAGPVYEFGDKLYRLMKKTLSEYLSEVQHFKEHIIKEREKVLKSEILEILHPLYVIILGHVRDETFQEYKMRLTRMRMKGETFVVANERSYDICKLMFEEQCKDVVEKLSASWDWSGCSKELCNEMENYASSVRSATLSQLMEEYQKDRVADYITKSLEYQLQNCTEDTYWASLREVVRMSTSENSGLISAACWEDTSLVDKMIQELNTYARNVVVDKLRAEFDKKVVNRMITRYGSVFCWDKDSTKRDWVDLQENAEAISHEASAAAIKLLAVMAVVQFDEKSNNCIEGVLLSSLMDANSSTTDHLDIDKWEGVSEDDTIIAPRKCESLWNQLKDTTEAIVKEVMSDMGNIKRTKGKEKGMQVMSVVSVAAGAVLVTAGILAVALTGGAGAMPVAGLLGAALTRAMVTPVAGLAGAVPVLAGAGDGLAGAMPVITIVAEFCRYFEKEKHKARQYAKDLEERHQQRCHKLFHGGQPSLQPSLRESQDQTITLAKKMRDCNL